MIHVCEEELFELFWTQQMQKITRCLLHDLSNYLTGSLALSELYFSQGGTASTEKFAPIRDNCYKEREILQQLSQLHHAQPSNVTYIDLQKFIRDLQSIFLSLLPAHTKVNLNTKSALEALIKFDTVLLQRIFLLTALLISEPLESVAHPKLDVYVLSESHTLHCRLQSNTILNFSTEIARIPQVIPISLASMYTAIVPFYLKKHSSSFSYDVSHDGNSVINFVFPLAE